MTYSEPDRLGYVEFSFLQIINDNIITLIQVFVIHFLLWRFLLRLYSVPAHMCAEVAGATHILYSVKKLVCCKKK